MATLELLVKTHNNGQRTEDQQWLRKSTASALKTNNGLSKVYSGQGAEDQQWLRVILQ
jgi:hypothetical protein